MSLSCLFRMMAPAAAMIGLVGQPAWADAACSNSDEIPWSADELPAAQLHAFQIMLMVGALKCRTERPDTIESYNMFVQARRGPLDGSRTILRAHFVRALGGQLGTTAFTTFDTAVGNRASRADHGTLQCDTISTYARLAASASDADLYTLARMTDDRAGLGPCPAAQSTAAVAAAPAAADPKLVPAVDTDAAPTDQAAVAPTLVADVVPEQPQAAATPASPPEATAQQTATGDPAPAAAPAKPDPAKALDDAAHALSMAAASLRNQTPTHP